MSAGMPTISSQMAYLPTGWFMNPRWAILGGPGMMTEPKLVRPYVAELAESDQKVVADSRVAGRARMRVGLTIVAAVEIAFVVWAWTATIH